MKSIGFALASLLFVQASGCTTAATPVTTVEDTCVENRAAIDIGSGATRIKVAKVDFCQMRLKEILFEKQEKMGYQEALQASKDGTLNAQVITDGSEIVKKLHMESLPFKPKRIVATASAAFREAKNGQAAAEEISKNASVPVTVIDQDLEGRLGFLGAAQKSENHLNHIAVWDVGAGSQQITVRKETGEIEVFKSPLASETFKTHIVQKIQRRGKAKSPNPISKTHKAAAVKYVKNQFANVPVEWRTFLQDTKTEVIGIGGVHYYSVRQQVAADQYDRALLSSTLEKRLGLSDQEVGGEYASTDVSNLILLDGVMDALGIEKVRAIKVDLSDGSLVYPEFWK